MTDKGHMSVPSLQKQLPTIILVVGVSVAALAWLFPFIWAIVTSLKTQHEISASIWALPTTLHWENYKEAFQKLNYLRTSGNTVFVATASAALQCVTGTLAAFSLARLKYPGRELIFTLLLATLMIPTTVTLTSNFLILRSLGWVDTYYALIIPTAASGFAIFLLRQFFLTVPKVSKPAMTTVFVFIFIQTYNEFLWPLIMTQSPEMRVIQIALRTFTSEMGVQDQGQLMAGAILALLPTVVLFAFCQKAFIRGITRTGLK